jgi:pyruvate-formate lyase-activating enzyme
MASKPTQPRASTREHAVVATGNVPTPMNDLVLPCVRNVETRGVRTAEMLALTCEVRVMVDGVRFARVGEGGNTKSV